MLAQQSGSAIDRDFTRAQRPSSRSHGLAARAAVRSVLCLGVVFIAAPVPEPAAINIVLNFNSAASESPAFDPILPGNQPPAGLERLFQYAETFYQDVFEDDHTLIINYWYQRRDAAT